MFTRSEISTVLGMLARGDKQHDIAAYFGVNGGCVAEVKTNHNGVADGIEPAPVHELPPAGPVMAGRSALRALDTLRALRDLIDESIADIEQYERGKD